MDNSYRFKPLEELIYSFIWEMDRINDDDREKTQKLIKGEILERAKRLIRTLEDVESLKSDLERRSIEEEVSSIMKWVVKPYKEEQTRGV